MTQAAVTPLPFMLFTSREVNLHFSYERCLSSAIRKALKANGGPICSRSRLGRWRERSRVHRGGMVVNRCVTNRDLGKEKCVISALSCGSH